MSKKILYQDNARKALEKGMKIMVEAVAVTLGPRGRNVVPVSYTHLTLPTTERV